MAHADKTTFTTRAAETRPPGKHAVGGRSGLWLVVSPTGARRWLVRVVVDGKRREMSLGSFPAVGLKEAKDKALDAQRLAKAGRDPIAERNKSNRIEASMPTFTSCAAHFIKAHRRGWSNRKHARQWVSTLKIYAKPGIGSKPVDQITTEDVLTVLSPIWHKRNETAKRVQGRIENILDYAAARKWRDPLNPARWRGHLDKLLAKPSRVKKVMHHPAMPYDKVPAFMAELEGNQSISALALRFLILTAARTSEVLQATWDEIDIDTKIWTVRAARMKAKREHRVPLSDAAMDIIKALPRLEGNPHLFPGAKLGRPLSNMALLQLMRGMGYGVGGNRGDYVPHGFRSAFRDWSGEISSFPRDVAEMALAHVIENKVEAAYRRGDLFDKRRLMMASWAAWCGKRGTKGGVKLESAGT